MFDFIPVSNIFHKINEKYNDEKNFLRDFNPDGEERVDSAAPDSNHSKENTLNSSSASTTRLSHRILHVSSRYITFYIRMVNSDSHQEEEEAALMSSSDISAAKQFSSNSSPASPQFQSSFSPSFHSPSSSNRKAQILIYRYPVSALKRSKQNGRDPQNNRRIEPQFVQKITIQPNDLMKYIYHANCFLGTDDDYSTAQSRDAQTSNSDGFTPFILPTVYLSGSKRFSQREYHAMERRRRSEALAAAARKHSSSKKKSPSRSSRRQIPKSKRPAPQQLLHLTYYNAEQRKYQTDMVLNGKKKVPLCCSEEYHQLECISPREGLYLMFSCRIRSSNASDPSHTRVKLLKLVLEIDENTHASSFKTETLQDFGKVVWYKYIGGSAKKLSLLRPAQTLPGSPTALKFEAFSLAKPSRSNLLYRHSLRLRHVPCLSVCATEANLEQSYPPLPHLIHPLVSTPGQVLLERQINLQCQQNAELPPPLCLWTKYDLLTLENSTEVLCRCYESSENASSENQIHVSLFSFYHGKGHTFKFHFSLVEEVNESIKEQISFSSHENMVLLFVSGQYLKLIDASQTSAKPKSLLTLRFSRTTQDILPTVPEIDERRSESSEPLLCPHLIRISQYSKRNTRTSFLRNDGYTLWLNVRNGRIYSMPAPRKKIELLVLRQLVSEEDQHGSDQQQEIFRSLVHMCVSHLHDYELSKKILAIMFSNSTHSSFLYFDLIEILQLYILSMLQEKATEEKMSDAFLSLLPNSRLFLSDNADRSTSRHIFLDVAEEMKQFPHGPKEWQELWVESSPTSTKSSSSATSPPSTRQKAYFNFLDFSQESLDSHQQENQSPSHSSRDQPSVVTFVKSFLQIHTKRDVLHLIGDPYSSSQQWLFFSCFKSVVFNALGKSSGMDQVDAYSLRLNGNEQRQIMQNLDAHARKLTKIVCEITGEFFEHMYSYFKRLFAQSTDDQERISLQFFRFLETFHVSLQEFGLPVPQNFSKTFVLQAYEALPRRRFLEYCDRDIFYIDHEVIQSIAEKEEKQVDLVSYLARKMHYKRFHSPQNRKEQHAEIKREIMLFRKSLEDPQEQTNSSFMSSSTLSSPMSRHSSVGGEQDSVVMRSPEPNIPDTNDSILTESVLAYYHHYIQPSPSNHPFAEENLMSSFNQDLSRFPIPSGRSPSSSNMTLTPLHSFFATLPGSASSREGEEYDEGEVTSPPNSTSSNRTPKRKNNYRTPKKGSSPTVEDSDTKGLIKRKKRSSSIMKQSPLRLNFLTPKKETTNSEETEIVRDLRQHAKQISGSLFETNSVTSPLTENGSISHNLAVSASRTSDHSPISSRVQSRLGFSASAGSPLAFSQGDSSQKPVTQSTISSIEHSSQLVRQLAQDVDSEQDSIPEDDQNVSEDVLSIFRKKH